MITPVKFELAKLLKEKGCEIATTDLYIDNELIYAEGRICNWNLEPEYEELENPISAPTIAEVVMWLYEKYGIWIYAYKIEPFIYDDTPYPKYVWISMCDEKFINTDNGLAINHHHSPTEAYEAAIEYCLTNLI